MATKDRNLRHLLPGVLLVGEHEPLPSWTEGSNAFHPECRMHRHEWVKVAARNNGLKADDILYATWYGANQVAVSGCADIHTIGRFLSEALGRNVEAFREGWQVVAEEAVFLGFFSPSPMPHTVRQLTRKRTPRWDSITG